MSQETEKPSGSDYDGLVKFVSWTPFIAGTVLLVLVVAYIVTFYQNGWAKNPDAWGQLGDYIGGLLNPLVAGLALLALVASVRLQKAELAATREELKESRQAMQEQAKTAEQQRCEQRFFDLFKIYKEVVNDFTITTRDDKFTGKAAIERFSYISSRKNYLLFPVKSYHYYENKDTKTPNAPDEEKEREINSADRWDKFIIDKKQYLRITFFIIEELERLLADNQWHYGKIFRSQLSGGEVSLLTLTLLFDEKGQTMHPLAAKYGLLKNLPASPLRTYAEQELPPLCFGRKWAAAHLAMPSEETQPC